MSVDKKFDPYSYCDNCLNEYFELKNNPNAEIIWVKNEKDFEYLKHKAHKCYMHNYLYKEPPPPCDELKELIKKHNYTRK